MSKPTTKAKEITHWKCEQCGRRGNIALPSDVDVYSAVEALRRAHAFVSPNCQTDLAMIRVSRTPLCN